MPRKQFKSVKKMLEDMAKDIDISSQSGYIPDIITFCESKDYLGLPFLSNPINLYPAQKIILKTFYRGSEGNEDIFLSDEEIELCKRWGLDSEDRGNLLGKYNSQEIFRELVLVWGRRSGKDFISSIVALYEAMRLLECEGGDPFAKYDISAANPISILTVATAKSQANIAFMEMKEKLLHSKYFQNKMLPDGIGSSTVWLLTSKDKLDNKDFKMKGLPLKKGSIVLEVGHSNSDSLLGRGVFVLILDEVASYKMTGSSSSGERIYTAMTPSLNTYTRIIPELDSDGQQVLDEEGKPLTKQVYDSKIVSISSPRGKEGIFWKLFSEDEKAQNRLSCRLPTWIVHPRQTEKALRINNSSMTEEEFAMEFGAEFSGTAGETFFPRESVESCFTKALNIAQVGSPGKVYFAHLDPARTSHNYAMAIVHKEIFLDPEAKKSDYVIVVDFLHYWHPLPGKPVKTEEVTDFVINMRRRFHFGLVTYDQWNSDDSIKQLRKHGMAAKCTPYVSKYKMVVYDILYRLVVGGRLKIPYHKLLFDEMLNLQRKYSNIGYKVYPPKEGDIRTDDLVDALAGAVAGVMLATMNKLPSGKLVNTGVMPQANNVLWRGMQGPLGVGSGKQIADRLEQRRPWPHRLGNSDFT